MKFFKNNNLKIFLKKKLIKNILILKIIKLIIKL